MTIGLFDSGIGGLCVLDEARRRLPEETSYLFYADRAHVPYGERTAEEIRGYAQEIVEFLLSHGAEAIVVACNTATSVAAALLRERYPRLPILGMEPAVKPALLQTTGRVMVIATPVTAREAKLHDLIERLDEAHRVDVRPLPMLVRRAEAGRFADAAGDRALAEALSDVTPDRYSALVLGCTHFGYFRRELSRLLGDEIRIFDGNEGTVRHLGEVLGLACHARGAAAGEVRFFDSGSELTGGEDLAFFSRLLGHLEEMDRR